MPASSTILGQHFAYAHGRMGVLKLLLLEQSDVDRLLGAKDLRETEKILTELKLTNVIDQGLSEGHAILEAVGTWMRNEVQKMSPLVSRPIFGILWLENDAPLLAYLLKKSHGLSSEISQEPLSGMNMYDPEVLRALILNEPSAGLHPAVPKSLESFVKKILAKEELSAQEIDSAVTKFVVQMQKRLSKTSGSRSIERYLEHRIDLFNIRTALRLSTKETKEVIPFLIEGGTIDPARLAGTEEEIASAIGRSKLSIFLPKDLESLLNDPIEFEQSAAHIVASDIAKMWNVPLTIDPLFAFAAITLGQLKLIRTILIAKNNELSPQETKHVLPPFLTASSFAS
ncbi:V-type ATPase subunit [Patescibacteria group bacterium]|nr:V-type ATPase subunit [Patescibacteria group bacterium]MBU2259242.1 V-type ATPase subunit [Patescibacteria group bacterium]